MLKTLRDRQLGSRNERQFVSREVNNRLRNLKFCKEVELLEEDMLALELSPDNELLLASSIAEFQIFKIGSYSPELGSTSSAPIRFGYGSIAASVAIEPQQVSLRWNRFDSTLFTKSGGNGTLQVWSLDCHFPRDTSPPPSDRFRRYTYHAADPNNLCILAALEHDRGVNIFDLRIGLDMSVMQIEYQPRPTNRTSLQILNLAFNPLAQQRLTTIGYRPGAGGYQIGEYDTRSSAKAVFIYDRFLGGRNAIGPKKQVPLEFSSDGHTVYTVVSGSICAFDAATGKEIRRVDVYEPRGLLQPTFRISHGANPELLFMPFRRCIRVYDVSTLDLVHDIPLQSPPTDRRDITPIALDTSRQRLYYADTDLQVYGLLPPGDPDRPVEPCRTKPMPGRFVDPLD